MTRFKESKEELVGYLKTMMHIRYFENKVFDLLGRNIAKGGSHLYAGEEAVAVGACAALRKDDYITSTHRGHGHGIAKGGNLKELMAEICGRATGCCKGRGGSLHLADLNTGNLGANGIVGGSMPIAVGAALSAKMRRSGQVVICFFGDGAANQGVAHESLNMAAVWDLPVVFVCENNLYAMSAPVRLVSSAIDLAQRAQSYNIPGVVVDGQDVMAVKEAVSEAVERARRGEGPSFIECKTYRYYGHSRSDPRVYRTREEEREWHNRDPIQLFGRQLIEAGIITEEEFKEIDRQAQADIDEAEKFALESPFPDPKELCEDLYV
ncbi:MAG: thiamine pyrophosphate-dependent dehydrogenase E1 component subunit alpha [bacterium]